jgi:hypothetical protein
MAIVSSYDWESDSWTQHNGDNLARQAFREAVAEIAEKAKQTLPDCIGRVDSAVKIVLNGDVELLSDGTAKVASQSNGTTKYFIVNGECTCKDYPKAPSNWCKHRIAAGLAKCAGTLSKIKLEQLHSASNGTTPPATEQPQGQPQNESVEASADLAPTIPPVEIPPQSDQAEIPVTHSEAPASCNTYITIAGRKVQVTLRDSDEQRLLTRLKVLLERFPVEEEPESAPTPPAEDWCPMHQCQTKERKGKYGPFYSHMTANGWCNGKKGK